jgi:hypothetical protein
VAAPVRDGMIARTVDLGPPALAISFSLDDYAPRLARHQVAGVDRPSPDLRDAVQLLVSELVTRVVPADPDQSPAHADLRTWMTPDLVRVEVWTSARLLERSGPDPEPAYDEVLVGHVADRWSVEREDERACQWFEIDRHEPHRGGRRL